MNAALLRLILAQVCIHGTMTGMRMATPGEPETRPYTSRW